MQGGKNYFLYGDVDQRDGQGAQSMLVQVIMSQPMQMGTWQMTVFRVQAPHKIFQEERATIAQLFPSYSANSQVIEEQMQRQIQADRALNERLQGMVADAVDQSDRSTAGMSNLLRNQTVLRDTGTGSHGTTSDSVADLLKRTFPGEFEDVPLSQYVKGIDY